MKSLAESTYHRSLRIALVVCAVVLLFDSGLVYEPSKYIASDTGQYLATVVGMSASVEPTELSLLTAELTKRERELAAREAALKEREIGVNLSSGTGGTDTSTYLMASILFILLILIVLNYALDYLRSRELQTTKPV
jgi:hypothetical protein